MAIVKMQKANKILRVDELLSDKYLKLGYNQISDKGEIVKRGNTSDKEVIKTLEDEITALKAELEAVKATKTKAVQAVKAQ